jgi:hypothetical protein
LTFSPLKLHEVPEFVEMLSSVQGHVGEVDADQQVAYTTPVASSTNAQLSPEIIQEAETQCSAFDRLMHEVRQEFERSDVAPSDVGRLQSTINKTSSALDLAEMVKLYMDEAIQSARKGAACAENDEKASWLKASVLACRCALGLDGQRSDAHFVLGTVTSDLVCYCNYSELRARLLTTLRAMELAAMWVVRQEMLVYCLIET